jgi:hypothetical protein
MPPATGGSEVPFTRATDSELSHLPTMQQAALHLAADLLTSVGWAPRSKGWPRVTCGPLRITQALAEVIGHTNGETPEGIPGLVSTGALTALLDELGTDSPHALWDWEEHPHRTQNDAITLLRTAATAAPQQHGHRPQPPAATPHPTPAGHPIHPGQGTTATPPPGSDRTDQQPEEANPLPASGPVHGLVVRYTTALNTGHADTGSLPELTGENAVAHAIVAAIHDTVAQNLPGHDWQTVLAYLLMPGMKTHARNSYLQARDNHETEDAAARHTTAELIRIYRTRHNL